MEQIFGRREPPSGQDGRRDSVTAQQRRELLTTVSSVRVTVGTADAHPLRPTFATHTDLFMTRRPQNQPLSADKPRRRRATSTRGRARP